MPFNLLKRLACAQLPANIEPQEDIDKLLVLLAAGLIEADIPPSKAERGARSYEGHAIVMNVTQLGCAALKKGSADLLRS